jgi:hypothetical protein
VRLGFVLALCRGLARRPMKLSSFFADSQCERFVKVRAIIAVELMKWMMSSAEQDVVNQRAAACY